MAEICSESMARAAESQGHALQDHGIEASYLNFSLMNERRRCRQIAVATLEVVLCTKFRFIDVAGCGLMADTSSRSCRLALLSVPF